MSFILDALKKSETDRQRQNGPALFEVKVAPPRNGLPLWAVGLGVLLAVNLVIVAWVLLRRPAQAEANSGQGQSVQASSGGSRGGGQYAGGAWQGPPAAQGGGQNWQGGQPGQGQNWQGGGQPAQGQNWQGGQSGQAQNWQGQPGQGQGGQGGQPGQGQNWQGQPGQAQGQGWQGGQPGQGQNWQGGQPGQSAEAPGGAPQGQQGQSMVPAGGTAPPGGSVAQAAGPTSPGGFNGAGDTGGDKLSADDYAPAADPPPAGPLGNHVTRSTSNGVPLYQEAALQPGTRLPELRLDLHVYAALPQNRFVMINMHKLREGDSLPEGVRVESITPEGAILSKDGTRFLLPRQ